MLEYLKKLKDVSLTTPLLEVLHDWETSKAYPSLGKIGAHLVGFISTPITKLVDMVMQTVFFATKAAAGLAVTPYNSIAQAINPKYEYLAPEDLGLPSALNHLSKAINNLFHVAILPLSTLFNPIQAKSIHQHEDGIHPADFETDPTQNLTKPIVTNSEMNDTIIEIEKRICILKEKYKTRGIVNLQIFCDEDKIVEEFTIDSRNNAQLSSYDIYKQIKHRLRKLENSLPRELKSRFIVNWNIILEREEKFKEKSPGQYAGLSGWKSAQRHPDDQGEITRIVAEHHGSYPRFNGTLKTLVENTFINSDLIQSHDVDRTTARFERLLKNPNDFKYHHILATAPPASYLKAVEKINLTQKLMDVLYDWNASETQPVLGKVGARLLGFFATPFTKVIDTCFHAILFALKTAASLGVTPYNYIVTPIDPKYKAPEQLEIGSALFHLARAVDSLINVVVMPIQTVIDFDHSHAMAQIEPNHIEPLPPKPMKEPTSDDESNNQNLSDTLQEILRKRQQLRKTESNQSPSPNTYRKLPTPPKKPPARHPHRGRPIGGGAALADELQKALAKRRNKKASHGPDNTSDKPKSTKPKGKRQQPRPSPTPNSSVPTPNTSVPTPPPPPPNLNFTSSAASGKNLQDELRGFSLQKLKKVQSVPTPNSPVPTPNSSRQTPNSSGPKPNSSGPTPNSSGPIPPPPNLNFTSSAASGKNLQDELRGFSLQKLKKVQSVPTPNSPVPTPNSSRPKTNSSGPTPNSSGPKPNSSGPKPNSSGPTPNSSGPIPPPPNLNFTSSAASGKNLQDELRGFSLQKLKKVQTVEEVKDPSIPPPPPSLNFTPSAAPANNWQDEVKGFTASRLRKVTKEENAKPFLQTQMHKAFEQLNAKKEDPQPDPETPKTLSNTSTANLDWELLKQNNQRYIEELFRRDKDETIVVDAEIASVLDALCNNGQIEEEWLAHFVLFKGVENTYKAASEEMRKAIEQHYKLLKEQIAALRNPPQQNPPTDTSQQASSSTTASAPSIPPPPPPPNLNIKPSAVAGTNLLDELKRHSPKKLKKVRIEQKDPSVPPPPPPNLNATPLAVNRAGLHDALQNFDRSNLKRVEIIEKNEPEEYLKRITENYVKLSIFRQDINAIVDAIELNDGIEISIKDIGELALPTVFNKVKPLDYYQDLLKKIKPFEEKLSQSLAAANEASAKKGAEIRASKQDALRRGIAYHKALKGHKTKWKAFLHLKKIKNEDFVLLQKGVNTWIEYGDHDKDDAMKRKHGDLCDLVSVWDKMKDQP